MEAVFSMFAEYYDLPILIWIREHLTCPILDTVMSSITSLGDKGLFWILIALVLLAIPKYRKAGVSMIIAMLIGLLICNVTLKPLFARQRPYDYLLEHYGYFPEILIDLPKDFSFPSGHTAVSIEAAMALLLFNKKLGIPAMILAGIISFSRLYLFVHYPTDVLASVILGICIGCLAHWLSGKLCQCKLFKNKL